MEGQGDVDACSTCKALESPTPLPQNSCCPFSLWADDWSCLNFCTCSKLKVIPPVHKNLVHRGIAATPSSELCTLPIFLPFWYLKACLWDTVRKDLIKCSTFNPSSGLLSCHSRRFDWFDVSSRVFYKTHFYITFFSFISLQIVNWIIFANIVA